MAQVAARPVTLELVSAQAQVNRAAKSQQANRFFHFFSIFSPNCARGQEQVL